MATLSSEYLFDLLRALAPRLSDEQNDVPSVRLEAGTDELLIVMEAGGRRLAYEVGDAVYAYEPDGSDPPRHASWLAQLFDEEAR